MKNKIRKRTRGNKRKIEIAPKIIELPDQDDSQNQYKCNVCEKIFLDKSSANDHINIHRPEGKSKSNSRNWKSPKKIGGKENRINAIQGRSVQGGAPSLGKRS